MNFRVPYKAGIFFRSWGTYSEAPWSWVARSVSRPVSFLLEWLLTVALRIFEPTYKKEMLRKATRLHMWLSHYVIFNHILSRDSHFVWFTLARFSAWNDVASTEIKKSKFFKNFEPQLLLSSSRKREIWDFHIGVAEVWSFETSRLEFSGVGNIFMSRF